MSAIPGCTKNTPPTPGFSGGVVPNATEFQSTVKVDLTLTVVQGITADSITTAHNVVCAGNGTFTGGISGGAAEVASFGAPFVITGDDASSGSGENGAQLVLTGGVPDGAGIPGGILLDQNVTMSAQVYGAPPNNMNPYVMVHILNTASPNGFNLPILDGSIPIPYGLYFIVYRGASGPNHAQIFSASGDNIGGPGLTVFAISGNTRAFPIILIPDLVNRTWWLWSGS